MTQVFKIGSFLIVLVLAVLVALGLRLRAVDRLPIDFDEDDYLLAGQHYAQAIREKDWGEIVNYEYNLEHPPLAKLTYGLILAGLETSPEVPQKPSTAPPAESLPQPHLNYLRWSSAIIGTLEVLALVMLDPLAGLFLAMHTFTIKYTSQVMLEALPALTSLLAVMAYARSNRSKRSGLWLTLSAIALGLTAAAKYMYALVGIVILIDWLWGKWEGRGRNSIENSWWKQGLPIIGWGVLAILVFFLADPYLWPDPLGRLRESLTFNVAYSQGEHVQSSGFPIWQPLTWLFTSVPWHPGVFVIAVDTLIALLALAGLGRMWRRYRVYALWLAVGLFFLLIWPTKWPQYILVVTAPVSLAAAEGFRGLIWEPLRKWLRGIFVTRTERSAAARRGARDRIPLRESLRAIPWLLPGFLILIVIAIFPLIYQSAISLTDFRSVAIRDGLTGGVWREVWLGLTGQVEPVLAQGFGQSFSRDMEVHYAGLSLLKQIVSGLGLGVLVIGWRYSSYPGRSPSSSVC
jgi:hypothetical protein